MKCPYCKETIKNDAKVCRCCLRNIYYIKDKPMTKSEIVVYALANIAVIFAIWAIIVFIHTLIHY